GAAEAEEPWRRGHPRQPGRPRAHLGAREGFHEDGGEREIRHRPGGLLRGPRRMHHRDGLRPDRRPHLVAAERNRGAHPRSHAHTFEGRVGGRQTWGYSTSTRWSLKTLIPSSLPGWWSVCRAC